MNATTELSAGIELDKLVAQACGIAVESRLSMHDEEELTRQQDCHRQLFSPSSDANDTLYAMDCLREKMCTNYKVFSFDNGEWDVEIEIIGKPHATADTFPLAVSRAIAQVQTLETGKESQT